MGAIHRFNGDFDMPDWDGVEALSYDVGGDVAGTRRVLVGPGDGSERFALRYFEIVPGGKSSHDKHAHEHGVMIVKGRARLQLEESFHDLAPGDVVFIAAWEMHQFTNTGREPLGFLCVSPPKTAPREIP